MTSPNGPAERNVRLTASAHNGLLQLALTMSAQVGRRISMSEAIDAARQVAARHPDELAAALAPEQAPAGAESEQTP